MVDDDDGFYLKGREVMYNTQHEDTVVHSSMSHNEPCHSTFGSPMKFGGFSSYIGTQSFNELLLLSFLLSKKMACRHFAACSEDSAHTPSQCRTFLVQFENRNASITP